jgi:septin 7
MDIQPKTVAIQSISADIEENGVRLRLTVIDTPGFGDFVNNDESWKPIVDNIDQRFDSYLDSENKVNRSNIIDNRIHACVYFIQPTGHSLKPLDIEVMRRLHTKVNLIPVIAKSDTLTDDEITLFKQRVSTSYRVIEQLLIPLDSQRPRPQPHSHFRKSTLRAR